MGGSTLTHTCRGRPTANGEMWVFNKGYTQYLPASIYDIQTWVGSPTIFVYDCSGTVPPSLPLPSPLLKG